MADREDRTVGESLVAVIMKRALYIFVISLLCVGCKSKDEIKADLSTPEGAILCLENAYRAKDIEAAVACKDFYLQAELLLKDTSENLSEDEAAVKRAAEILEVSYRKHIEQEGFPDFNDVKSSFPSKEYLSEDVVKVTEVRTYPDGGTSYQEILVGKSVNAWKVLKPL